VYRLSHLVTPLRCVVLLIIATLSFTVAAQEGSQPEAITLASTFTYQGYIEQNAIPVTGNCDFQFSLFDTPAAGAQVGSTLTRTNVPVSGGIFNVALNFGLAALTGQDRYLAVGARCPAGAGAYTALTPRQPLTPVPYAIALYGFRTGPTDTSPNIIGGFSGNLILGATVGATISGGGFSGEPNQVTNSYGTVGGGSNNRAGSTSGSNGTYTTVGGGQ
jgi:hypothetical protein